MSLLLCVTPESTDREFEFYEFFSFLKFNEFYVYVRYASTRKYKSNTLNYTLLCFDIDNF